MPIATDWGIDYVNQRVYNLRAWGLNGSDTVYTVNALYSWLMDVFDDLDQMDNPVPMEGVTPTVYRFINQWFIDDESVKYLKGGSIETVGYDGNIQVLTLQETGYEDCRYSDIGKMVTADGANTGNLLAFDNTKRKWWIRYTSTIASGSAMRIDGYIQSAKSYNANTAAYTNETTDINEATVNDVVLPPIQTTTVGDAIYVGDDYPFAGLRLKYSTAGVYTGITLEWQYWNGSAWATLTVTDPTSFFTAAAGTYNITWTPPADWASTTVDGVTKYWIRCVVTAFATPSITTAPLGDQGWVGSGAGTAAADSVTGEDLYANIYTLGTIETTPAAQMYVFQAGERLAEWSYLSNWDRGHIDVLIKVKEAGTEIDGAVITVFNRQTGDFYDNYEIDLSAGGRNAVPIATAQDLDNLTGDFYLLYDGEVTAFSVGDVIVGATSGAYAEVAAVEDWNTTGLLTLRGVRGAFQDNENLQVAGTTYAVVNGTLGDTYLKYTAETAAFTVDQTLTGATSGAKRLIRGIQDDGTTGKLVLQVDTTVTGSARNPYYRAFQDGETITDGVGGSATADGASTTIVSGYSDITIAFVNGTASHAGTTGTFTENERVTWDTREAILLRDDANVITLGNVSGPYTGDLETAQSYNANTAVYTDETEDLASSTANDVALPPIQTTTVGDAIYFGHGSKFPYLRLNVGTAGVYSDITLEWQYWNGTAWTTLTVTDGTSLFTVAGINVVYWTPPTDWDTTSVNGITQYWVRCVVTGFGASPTITTAPLGTQGWIIRAGLVGSLESAKSYNANTAAYTDETTDLGNATPNDVALPPIQTTTSGDAIYFGDDATFEAIRLNIGTAGVYSDITIAWEYWNGSAWTALTVTDPTASFTNRGIFDITWTAPADWATTTVDGVTKYWIRAVATLGASPAITTSPLASQGWIGRVVTGDISGATCRPTEDLVSAHTMNKAMLKQPAYPYDIIVDCASIYEASRGVADVYEYFKLVTRDGVDFKMYTVSTSGIVNVLEGQEYIIAYEGYSPKKASPLATFAGGVLFGAQGLWIENMATEDIRNYTLIDSNGVKRDPPNIQTVKVTALGQVDTVWDKVSVFRTVALGGDINKAMFTSHPTANAAPGTTFTVVETIEADVPDAGYIRLRKEPTGEEERIAYTSWSGSVFTLATAHSGGYDGDDTAYVPFIDDQATASEIEQSVIYIADRTIVTRVRNKGIIPFEIHGTFVSVGYTVAAIRTTDTIVT